MMRGIISGEAVFKKEPEFCSFISNTLLRKVLTYSILLAIYLLTFGCAGALIAGGGVVATELEDVDVKAALQPYITYEDLQKIRRVAVIIATESQIQTDQQSSSTSSRELINIMLDNITLELMNLGFHVIERISLDKVLSEQGLQLTGAIDARTAARVGKIMGIDAVVLSNIIIRQKILGHIGIGSRQVISDATMRVVGIEKGDVVMIVTLSYKKGQKPAEAAKTMAIALSQKLKNPLRQKEQTTDQK